MEFRFDPQEHRFRVRTLVPPGEARVFVADDEAFSFGIEEEYFIADAKTLQVASETPESLFALAECGASGRVGREFLQAQIEVATEPHDEPDTARLELQRLRQNAAGAATAHGLAILACGTHPSARWPLAVQSPKERYTHVMDVLQMIGQRNMLCGMHVHVEFPDPTRRVDVMTRMLPYLPVFIALSTSSPFWQSRRTGLRGYRLAAYDELPRSGVPELLRTREEFDAYVAALVQAGVIEDSSFIWWAIRPSLENPTLELRAPDSCTLVEDSIAIAALYRTLTRYLYVNRWRNSDLNAVTRALIVENKWRAQRYGVHGTFVTEAGALTVAEMLEEVIGETAADAAALGCAAEIDRCRAIVGAGTSADVQLAVYEAQSDGAGRDAALRAVLDWIAAATPQ